MQLAYSETTLLAYLKSFENQSVLLKSGMTMLKKYGMDVNTLRQALEAQLFYHLEGEVHDLVRQEMTNAVVMKLHEVQEVQEGLPAPDMTPKENNNSVTTGQLLPPETTVRTAPTNLSLRDLPLLQLFELAIHKNLKVLDLSQNSNFKDGQKNEAFCRHMWDIVAERCCSLQKLILSNGLLYCSSMKQVLKNNQSLTHLTLKRNVPENRFLADVGALCPNLKVLDIAGADIVTDFGIVCLLMTNPERIIEECWDRDKPVGGNRPRFPHRFFDYPVFNVMDQQLANSVESGNYLYLRQPFLTSVRDAIKRDERRPICNSLERLYLESTRVKGDGAAVVIEVCPNITSLGYLVFTAAGVMNVFGEGTRANTNLTEIFFRGPSDPKLNAIGNCCPKLTTIFIGDNSVRRLTTTPFSNWKCLQFLTLENIFADDVVCCLRTVGRQLKGLKLLCSEYSVTDVAATCPILETLVIQGDGPRPIDDESVLESKSHYRIFRELKHVEADCRALHKSCLNYIMTNALNLSSIKVFRVTDLTLRDFELWAHRHALLQTFIIFHCQDIDYESVMLVEKTMPRLQTFGRVSAQVFKRLQSQSSSAQLRAADKFPLQILEATNTDEDKRRFLDLQKIHWFHLTETPDKSE